MSGRVSVMLPLGFAGALDYVVPDGLALAPGDYVEVPLGKRIEPGVVWGPAIGGVDEAKLKPVAARLPVPPMPEAQRRFVDWVASYTLSGPGAVLRMALSVPDALVPPRALQVWRIAPGYVPPQPITPARQNALAAVIAGGPLTAAEIRDIAGVGDGVVKALVKAGALVAETRPAPVEAVAQPDPARAAPVLSPAQGEAATRLAEAVRARRYAAILLEGVTGSGKTEVYFEAVAQALRAGRQALVLLPEIALSAQWLGRFEARFGAPPTVWHSDVRGAERRRNWRAVADGRAKVVVGARSALFLPFADLGLIVVDEEHEGSFKQEEGVIYHARDMAVVRAHLAGIPVVLASATPALETLANVDRGRYAHALLPQRHGGAVLPRVELVDLRRAPPPRGRWLSPALASGVDAALAAGEQAMLFLNRRGYAPLTLCRACGHRMHCPHCSACLVEHRLASRLQCHHCGFVAAPPSACPSCGAADSFAACGPGVERLAEEAAARFPNARLAVMTSDTIRGPAEAEAVVSAMAQRQVDLLIGTQIVAKGHNFPWLTLVGVVDADLGLAGGDPRASERTWQLLSQVGGRAGRAERPGRVLLQTYMPEHPVLQALAEGDQARFLAEEMAARREQGLPPFGRLAALIVSGPQQAAVEKSARELAAAAPRREDVRVLGPAPAPLAVLRGHHRQRLLVKAGRDVALQPILRRWLALVKTPAAVKIKVDIDPYSFL